MHKVEVTILAPEAEEKLDQMEHENLIKVEKKEPPKKKRLGFGSMKGLVEHIDNDFDTPLDVDQRSSNSEKLAAHKKKSRAERRAFYLSAPVMSDDAYQNYLETREWMNRWRTK